MHTIFAILVILHGLVHMWYVTLSQDWVTFQSEMGWTGHSWLLSNVFGEKTTTLIASTLFILCTILFTISGIGLLAKAGWSRNALALSSIISLLTLLVFWDGKPAMLVEKGLIGLLVNIGILILIYATNWIAM